MKRLFAVLCVVALTVACGGGKSAPSPGGGTGGPVVAPSMPPSPAQCKEGTHIVVTSGTGTTAVKKCLVCTGGRFVPEPCPSYTPKPVGTPVPITPQRTIPNPPMPTRPPVGTPVPVGTHKPTPTVCKEGSISAVGGPNGPVCEQCHWGEWIQLPVCPGEMHSLQLKAGEKAVMELPEE